MGREKQQSVKLPKLNLKYTIGIVAALVAAIYIISATQYTFLDFATILGFIIIGAISRIPERFAPISIGIELISVFTFVSAIKYSPLVGALVGVAAFTISGYYTFYGPQDILVADIGFIVFAFLAPIMFAFFGGDIGFAAIALTLTYDIITGIFYYFGGHGFVGVARFTAVHTTANFFIISYLGARLLGI